MTRKHTTPVDNPVRIIGTIIIILTFVQIILVGLILSGNNRSIQLAIPHPCEKPGPISPPQPDKCQPTTLTELSTPRGNSDV